MKKILFTSTLISLCCFLFAAQRDKSFSAYVDSNFCVKAVVEGNIFIWIGTDHGLIRINKKNNTKLWLTKSNSMLPSNYVTCIAASEDGMVFIGTSSGILRFDNYSFTLIDAENTDLPDEHITALAFGRNHDMWIGTYFGGLVKMRFQKCTVYNSKNSVLKSDCILSLSTDETGNLWIGLLNGGLVRMKDNEWEVFDYDEHRFDARFVMFVKSEKNGCYLVGTHDKGLFEYDGVSIYPIKFLRAPNLAVTNVSNRESALQWNYLIPDYTWRCGR